jgi:hypothetical protein
MSPRILVPALITLAVTLLRLVGELNQWSSALFNRAAGGGGALVGIVWLIPVFGVYFALKLRGSGQGPVSAGKVIGFSVVAFAIPPLAGGAAGFFKLGPVGLILVFSIVSLLAIAVAWPSWPALARVLVAYGVAARIPVALIMLAAILGDWGTHYDVPAPDFPAMGKIATWFWIGLLPQLTIWIYMTVVMGMLFGGLAAAIADRRKTAA